MNFNDENKNLVSVLLTSYNRPKMVKEAIESVLNQTYRNFELIILDDNSDRETLDVIYQYLKSPVGKKIVFLKLAKGKFITYLCDDDLYLANRLEKMVEFFENNPEARVCYGRQKCINLETKEESIRQPDIILNDPAFCVDHSSVMHYKSCIDEVGYWDTKDIRASDAYFWRKLGAKFPFYPILEVLDVHRYHSDNIASKIDKKMFLNPQLKLLWCGDRVKSWLERKSIAPVLIEIAPTGYCNASCPWCFFKDKRGTEKICAKMLIKTLKDLAKAGVKAVNWTGGGEPTLHPNFADFVKVAHEFGLKQGLFTNGYLEIPHQEAFSWIRISLTDKGFEPIKKPKVPFGICLNQTESESRADLEELCKKAKGFGASYFQIRPALVGNYIEQPKLSIPYFLENLATKNFKWLSFLSFDRLERKIGKLFVYDAR